MKIDSRQDLRYLITIWQEPGDSWAPHVTGEAKPTRYHVAKVEVRVDVEVEGIGPDAVARFTSGGAKILKGWRIRGDGTHGAPIGQGHYWIPRAGSVRGRQCVEDVEHRAVTEAMALYLAAFGPAAPPPVREDTIIPEAFTRTGGGPSGDIRHMARSVLDTALGPNPVTGTSTERR